MKPADEPRHVEVHVADRGATKLLVDGHDIARYATYVRIEVDPIGGMRVTVELIPEVVTVNDDLAVVEYRVKMP